MRRILHVDDSKPVHSYVESLLSDQNVALEHAYSGEEALSFIRDNREFDTILLDWEMPGMPGVDVLAQLRAEGYNFPIIMVTSKNSPDDIASVLSLGASEYIMKPFTKDILLEKLAATAHPETSHDKQ